jgi:hypothetical protein
MATERQILANRANALKSTGPKSAEGKARVSRNAVRHGLRSSRAVLQAEEEPQFESCRDALVAEFKPRTVEEQMLVQSMALSQICQRRVWAMQTEALEEAISQQPLAAGGAVVRAALAFRSLADHSTTLQTLLRYEAAFDRQFNWCLNTLLKLRANKPATARPEVDPFTKNIQLRSKPI